MATIKKMVQFFHCLFFFGFFWLGCLILYFSHTSCVIDMKSTGVYAFLLFVWSWFFVCFLVFLLFFFSFFLSLYFFYFFSKFLIPGQHKLKEISWSWYFLNSILFSIKQYTIILQINNSKIFISGSPALI